MDARQGQRSSIIPADIVARDRDGRIVLLVEIKAPPGPYISERPDARLVKWAGQWVDRDGPLPYLMVANVRHILIFPPKMSVVATSDARPGPTWILDDAEVIETGSVLVPYDPSYLDKVQNGLMYESYLKALIEAWLSDLASHWKLADPPRADTLARIGLLSRLIGGWAGPEDRNDDPLY